eukprot:SAG22_NODE_234_length_14360_cov_13.245915_15_plen_41_part_00
MLAVNMLAVESWGVALAGGVGRCDLQLLQADAVAVASRLT